MMFEKEDLYSGKRAVRRYRLSSFENAAKAVNVCCEKRKMRSARGFRSLGAPAQGAGAAALYAAEGKLFCLDGGGNLYGTEGGAFAPLSGGFSFASPPAFCEAFNGSEFVPLFSDGENSLVCLAGGLYPSNVPPFRAACWFYERLWIYAGGKLRFGAPLKYDDFTVGKNGGGEICLPDGRGEISALVPFENRLYIFREYGIQRLDVRGEQTDFEITDCAFFGERIIEKTIACGGEGVYFCNEAGLYRMEGGSVSKIREQYFEKYAPEPIKGAYAEGGYCLLAESGGETFLHIFGKEKTETLRADFTDICGANAACACIAGGEVLVRGEGAAPVYMQWKSEPDDLGAGARKKVLERVILRGKGFFLLRAEGEKSARTFEVRFLGGRAELNAGMVSDFFAFTLESDSAEAEIYEISCLYTLARGGKL